MHFVINVNSTSTIYAPGRSYTTVPEFVHLLSLSTMSSRSGLSNQELVSKDLPTIEVSTFVFGERPGSVRLHPRKSA